MGFLLVWMVICGGVGGLIGEKHNRTVSGVVWGALLGPIGWLIVFLLPDQRPKRAKCLECGERAAEGARLCQHCSHLLAEAIPDSLPEKKKCPFCAELIKREAIKCRFCGSDLREKQEHCQPEHFAKNQIEITGADGGIKADRRMEEPKSGDSPDQNRTVCTCNHCSRRLRFNVARVGTTIQCPHCGKETKLFKMEEPTSGENPNQTWVVCTCNNCSEHLEFDASHAGETIQCPHCKLDTVLFIPARAAGSPPRLPADDSPGIRWGRFVGAIVILLSLLVIFFAAAKNFLSRNQTPESQTPIEGLFGIKLGEPLPAYAGNDFNIDPPEPNSAFTLYSVTLDPTNNIVTEIHALSSDTDWDTRRDVLNTLRRKYGPERKIKMSDTWVSYQWRRGTRQLKLDEMNKSLDLTCTDSSLYHPSYWKPPDTKGL
jgi:hypothetical protein